MRKRWSQNRLKPGSLAWPSAKEALETAKEVLETEWMRKRALPECEKAPV
jgi:hypothetical protein